MSTNLPTLKDELPAPDLSIRRLLIQVERGLPKPGDPHPKDPMLGAAAIGCFELFPNGDVLMEITYEMRKARRREEVIPEQAQD